MTRAEADGFASAGENPIPRAILVPGAVIFGIALVATAASSGKVALLLSGSLLGAVGLLAIIRFAPARATDCLFLLLVGLVAVPIDAYLGYQEHVGGWPGFRFAVSDVGLYLLVGIALLGRLLRRVESPIPARVVVFAALLAGWYGISAALAERSDLALFEIASTLHAFVLAWIVAAIFRRDQLGFVLVLVALQLAAHSGLAIAQGVTGRPIGAGWLGGNAELLTEVLEGGEARLRPAGLMAHPIVYATSLVIWLPLLAGGLGAARHAGVRLVCAGGLVIGLVGLLLTLSRGAWISSLLAFALLGALAVHARLIDGRRLRNRALVLLVAGAVIGAPFAPRVYSRLTRSASGNVDVRFDLNQIALRMTADHPFFGAGLNNFVERMSAYDPKDVMEYFPAPVHNLYLLESSEAGIPALGLFLALFATILLGALHHLPRMRDPELGWIVAACIAGLGGFLLSQLADFSHRLEPLRSIVWFQVGLLFGALQENRPRRRHARAPTEAARS